MYDLGIVVVNYHTDRLLLNFLQSLNHFKPLSSLKIIVQDVGKEYDFPVSSHYYTYNRYKENVGYAKACNDGASFFGDSVRNLAFFNADTEFTNDVCVDLCVEFLDSNSDVGVVGPLQLDESGRVSSAGIIGSNTRPDDRGWMSRHPDRFRDVVEAISVSGSAYFTPRRIWEEMTECPIYRKVVPDANGGFLPTELYYEETFYSYHVREHGYKVVYLGTAEMKHLWKKSPDTGRASKAKRSKTLFRKACDIHGIHHH